MSTARFDVPVTKADAAALAAGLRASHATTLQLVGAFDAAQWIGPYLPIVNPPLWELGHVAWFLERWVLRRQKGTDSVVADADRLYDSSRIAHVARWFLRLPSPAATWSYLSRVTDEVLRRLDEGSVVEPAQLYYVELSLYHQDMHNEAFRYTRQTLGYGDPLAGEDASRVEAGPRRSNDDVCIPAGTVSLGATRNNGFVFDNEKWAHEVRVPAFAISREAVTNGEFLAFVEAGGYARRELWSEAGWRWRDGQAMRHPVYWRRGDRWRRRVFDRWEEVAPDEPVIHVSAFEAEAYCRWAQRRLPSEAEWMRAAATSPNKSAPQRYPWGDAKPEPGFANLDGRGLMPVDACPRGDSGWGCRQMLGNVWEWTASPFEPYPGFSPDPYEDYSRPWFGTHRVLRGGSFATPARLARNAFRNFYTPERADVFCGFRTCTPA